MSNTELEIDDLKQDSFIYKSAKLVSNVLHPMTLSSVAFALLAVTSKESIEQKIILIVTTVFFSSILPILFIYLQRERFDTDKRTERFLPLIVGIVSYFLGFLVLTAINAPIIIQVLMFCYATNTLVVLLITTIWKVSVHTTAASGPLVALTYSFGGIVFPFYSLIVLVGISRLILKKHTLLQVMVGMLIGIIGTALQIHYIFNIPFPSL